MQTTSHISLPKLRPPRLTRNLLERPRLLSRLDQGLSRPFTFVGAPAGYGKTTLLAQWVGRQDRAVAWLALDEADNDLGLFLEEVVAAVRNVFPGSCQSIEALLARPQLPPVGVLGRELVNGLDELDELILVLDDFHSLKNTEALEIVRSLIHQPPGSLHLVLASRADPVLPLGSLRGRGLMNEMRVVDLRFSLEEATEYLAAAFRRSLTEAEVNALLDRTEGWIAGLHLAALSLSGREDLGEGISDFAGSDRYVVEYLMDELWNQLDPKVREYLLATSILNRLSAPLCEEVVGVGVLRAVEGRPVLEWLEDSSLFTVSLDERRQWFRYHHLFRDLLRRMLQATWSADDIGALHVRAADWLSDHGQVDEALEHFLKVDRAQAAADVVEARRTTALEHEEWRTLKRWMDMIDAAVVDARPRLVLAHAWLADIRHDQVGMARLRDRAEQLLDQQQPPLEDEMTLRGEIGCLRAEADFWEGCGDKAIASAREALEYLPADRHLTRATAGWYEGGGLHLLGRNDEALEVFRRHSFGDYGGSIHPRAVVGLYLVAMMTGDVDYAYQVANPMLTEATRQGLWESAGWARYFLGLCAYLRNDLAEAEKQYAEVQPYATHIAAVKQCFYGLAWVRQAQGRPDEAIEVLDKFRSIVSDLNTPLHPEIQMLEGRLTVLSGRPTRDLALARGALEAANRGPSFLQLCYEFSPINAIAILGLQGNTKDLEDCHETLRSLLVLAETNGNVYRRVECLLLQTLLFDRQDRNPEALGSLAEAVSLARPGRMIRLFPDMGQRVYALLQTMRLRGTADLFLDELTASFAAEVPSPSAGHYPSPTDPKPEYLIDTVLSNRELDVLALLDERLSNKEIARRLVISPATVKRHTISIYAKLSVDGRREAVAKARHLGILRS